MRTFLLFLCIPLLLSAQEVEVKRERTYNASGLYGFMNGGTDQFLEYGVKQLVVRDIIFKGEEYVVEIYDMPTPEDAFGIYSLHTFRCERADTLNCINCLSPYQLQAVSGNQYVSIVFPSGSAVAQQNADERMKLLPFLLNYCWSIPSQAKSNYSKGLYHFLLLVRPLQNSWKESRISLSGIWQTVHQPAIPLAFSLLTPIRLNNSKTKFPLLIFYL